MALPTSHLLAFPMKSPLPQIARASHVEGVIQNGRHARMVHMPIIRYGANSPASAGRKFSFTHAVWSPTRVEAQPVPRDELIQRNMRAGQRFRATALFGRRRPQRLSVPDAPNEQRDTILRRLNSLPCAFPLRTLLCNSPTFLAFSLPSSPLQRLPGLLLPTPTSPPRLFFPESQPLLPCSSARAPVAPNTLPNASSIKTLPAAAPSPQ